MKKTFNPSELELIRLNLLLTSVPVVGSENTSAGSEEDEGDRWEPSHDEI